jgi:hypothetical protein
VHEGLGAVRQPLPQLGVAVERHQPSTTIVNTMSIEAVSTEASGMMMRGK